MRAGPVTQVSVARLAYSLPSENGRTLIVLEALENVLFAADSEKEVMDNLVENTYYKYTLIYHGNGDCEVLSAEPVIPFEGMLKVIEQAEVGFIKVLSEDEEYLWKLNDSQKYLYYELGINSEIKVIRGFTSDKTLYTETAFVTSRKEKDGI